MPELGGIRVERVAAESDGAAGESGAVRFEIVPVTVIEEELAATTLRPQPVSVKCPLWAQVLSAIPAFALE